MEPEAPASEASPELPPAVCIGPVDAGGFSLVEVSAGGRPLSDHLRICDQDDVRAFCLAVEVALGEQAAEVVRNRLQMAAAHQVQMIMADLDVRWAAEDALIVFDKSGRFRTRLWRDETFGEQLRELEARLALLGVGSFASDVAELAKQGPPRALAGKRSLARPLRLRDIERLARRSDWIVRGVIERGSLALLFGAPASFKTFIALDLSLRLAHGQPAWGRAIRPTPVAYFSGEGQRSVARRILAWRARHAPDGDLDRVFRLLGEVPNLGDPVSVLEARDIVADLRPGLLVIDTLSTACAGVDENAAGEIVQVLSQCRELARPFGAAVLLVHHTSKDRKSARGSSVLTANVDAVLRVEGNQGELFATLTCEKSRDDAPSPVSLQLSPQAIDGNDAAGNPMPTSLVVSEVREAPGGVHQEFIEFIEQLRERPLPAGLSSLTFTEMVVAHELYEAGESTRKGLIEAVLDLKPEVRQNSVRNCLTALRRRGWAEPDMNQKASPSKQFRPSPAASAFFESASRSSSDER